MATSSNQSAVALSDICIRYGQALAVDHVSIDIRSGEFFTLLGPSGCGKTTLLRAIAGFNRQTSGTIRIGDVVADDLPPHKRDTGMVFQNYAIFPHLNVRDNVAYGLRSRKVARDEIERRVSEALAMVDLGGYENRMPRQLSGGQQQRVVIARAIVIRPRVLLMDEPLANLDAKLRVRLREDLRALQQKLGITTIYVTHDQEEALSISDRIAVMSKGKALQIGTPEEIYAAPSQATVAGFVGEGTFLKGVLNGHSSGEPATIRLTNGHELAIGAHDMRAGDVRICIRPEDVSLAREASSGGLTGTVLSRSYYGPFIQLYLDAGLETSVLCRAGISDRTRGLKESDRVHIQIDATKISVFPATGEVTP